MSPIDDQLRALLQTKADDLDPAPDPLGGIESRARGLRRRRVLASAAGAAVVVAAVAVAVPLAVSGSSATVRQPGSTTPPTSGTSGAFDEEHPWATRGTPISDAIDPGTSSTLFTQTYAGAEELYYAGNGSYGYVLRSPDGHESTDKQPLPSDLRALMWALPGDDGRGRLVVIADPGATVEYASEGDGYQQISDVGQAPKGIGLVPIEAEAPHDTIRVTEADGTQLVEPAPDWTPPDTGTPVNVLNTWVHRGDPQSIPDATVVTAFDKSTGKSSGHYRALYDGVRNGLRFTIGQAWDDGDAAAQTVAYDTSGTLFLGPQTPRDPWVLGAVFANGGKDLLVLLPRPGAGRIGYSPDATSAFTDVASGRSDLNPVGLVDRDPMAQADRVQVHRGDDSVILTEGIAKLTCAVKECG